MPEHAHRTLGRLDQTREQVEHGRLAAASPAQHRNHLARRDLEAQAVDSEKRFLAPVLAQEALHNVAEVDFRRGGVGVLAAHAERSAVGR